MYALKSYGIINEIKCGNNFGYILKENKYFVSTGYKVLQNQTDGVFVQCMKMLYNGKIELYYMTDNYRALSTMLTDIPPEVLVNIIINMFVSVMDVQNNGFLSCQNIDISWDKIFIDPSTLKVKLVYLPIDLKIPDSNEKFESELRSNLVRLINEVMITPNDKLTALLSDLANGSISINDIYIKFARTKSILSSDNGESKQQTYEILKMVAMNAPTHFEIILDKDDMLLGKKREIVDIAISFNNRISRKHCRIVRNNGKYYITDEESMNGTYVNRIKIVPHQFVSIKKGDIIGLANSNFQLI